MEADFNPAANPLIPDSQTRPQVPVAMARTFTFAIRSLTVRFSKLALGRRSSSLPLILKSKKPFLKQGAS